jgi:NAD(P)-dependent dehydrogenase (short-subunit alcohol dehydrogenase family)
MAGALAGKVAVITGAGRGIGRAVAAAYAREGARLALCSRTKTELDSSAAEFGRLGRDALPGWGAYGVSKWGLEGLTRYLALELKPSGIRVNSVSPGYVATKMTNNGGAKPESVVDLFVYLASEASSAITGQALDVETWKRERGIRRK